MLKILSSKIYHNFFLSSKKKDTSTFEKETFSQSLLHYLSDDILNSSKILNAFSKHKKKIYKNSAYVNYSINYLMQLFHQKNIFESFKSDNSHIINKMKKKNYVHILSKKHNFSLEKEKKLHRQYQKNQKKNYNRIFFVKDIIDNRKNKNHFSTVHNLIKKDHVNHANLHHANLHHIKRIFINNTQSIDKKNNIVIPNSMNNAKINIKNYGLYQLCARGIKKISFLIPGYNIVKKNIFCDTTDIFFLNNIQKNTEWKKAISQQILFSILNKEDQAEIHIKPKNLGPIYIRIQIKNDNTIVNLVSNYNDINTILKNSIPFLKKSLIRSGLPISKININSILITKKITQKTIDKSYKKLKQKIIFHTDNLKKLFYNKITKKEYVRNQDIDIYV